MSDSNHPVDVRADLLRSLDEAIRVARRRKSRDSVRTLKVMKAKILRKALK